MNNITREKRKNDDVFQPQPIKYHLEGDLQQQFIQKRKKLNEDEYFNDSDKIFHKKLRSQKFVPPHFKRQFLCSSLKTSQSKVLQTLPNNVLRYCPEPRSNFNQIMLNNDHGILRSIEKPPGIMHDRLCMVNNQ